MSEPSAQPAAPAPETTPPAQPPATSAASFTQEQLNAALAEEKRKWKRQQDEAAEKTRREAEEAAAAQRGEFEKLATERQTRVTQLESEQASTAERLTAYEAEMERQIKARLRNLPEEIRAMAPEGDTLARFAWLDKAEAAAQKLSSTQTPGTPAGPRGSGAAPTGATNNGDAIARKKASGDYGM